MATKFALYFLTSTIIMTLKVNEEDKYDNLLLSHHNRALLVCLKISIYRPSVDSKRKFKESSTWSNSLLSAPTLKSHHGSNGHAMIPCELF